MDIPLELSFHNIEPSDALKTAVREHVDKLKQLHDHIIGCRVVIEMPHKSQKASGNQPDVHIVERRPVRHRGDSILSPLWSLDSSVWARWAAP